MASSSPSDYSPSPKFSPSDFTIKVTTTKNPLWDMVASRNTKTSSQCDLYCFGYALIFFNRNTTRSSSEHLLTCKGYTGTKELNSLKAFIAKKEKAKESRTAAQTARNSLIRDITYQPTHASDDVDDEEQEAKLFFPQRQWKVEVGNAFAVAFTTIATPHSVLDNPQ
ncbi:hypothetical protein P9112_000120 [Eukaryota sp. TZLM1-RC]